MGTTEAALSGVPVQAIVGHLSMVHTDMVPTGLTVFSVERLKASATVRSSILHNVALPTQNCLAFETGEVLHVPVATLSFRALISKDDLITGRTAGFKQLRVMPSTVDLPFVIKVDKVHKKLAAGGTGEAGRVPTHPWAHSGCRYSHLSTTDAFTTMLANTVEEISRQHFHGSPPERLLFPLDAEHLQLLLLLFTERLAITDLIIVWWELIQELLDSEFLTRAVHIRDFILGETGEKQLYLFQPESRWYPGVLLQCAARVVVRGGAALEAKVELADFVLHDEVLCRRPALEAD